MAVPHTEAAFWAEGTPYTADELIRGYNDWCEYSPGGESFEWWCEHVMKIENDPNRKDER
jgi:hypothetical protein